VTESVVDLIQRSAVRRNPHQLVLMCAALATAIGASITLTWNTWPSAVSLAWLIPPAPIASAFFDTGAGSRRVACRVVSAVLAFLAVILEPLGLLYLVPSVLLCGASFVRVQGSA
jgi:hypothetical protein